MVVRSRCVVLAAIVLAVALACSYVCAERSSGGNKRPGEGRGGKGGGNRNAGGGNRNAGGGHGTNSGNRKETRQLEEKENRHSHEKREGRTNKGNQHHHHHHHQQNSGKSVGEKGHRGRGGGGGSEGGVGAAGGKIVTGTNHGQNMRSQENRNNVNRKLQSTNRNKQKQHSHQQHQKQTCPNPQRTAGKPISEPATGRKLQADPSFPNSIAKNLENALRSFTDNEALQNSFSQLDPRVVANLASTLENSNNNAHMQEPLARLANLLNPANGTGGAVGGSGSSGNNNKREAVNPTHGIPANMNLAGLHLGQNGLQNIIDGGVIGNASNGGGFGGLGNVAGLSNIENQIGNIPNMLTKISQREGDNSGVGLPNLASGLNIIPGVSGGNNKEILDNILSGLTEDEALALQNLTFQDILSLKLLAQADKEATKDLSLQDLMDIRGAVLQDMLLERGISLPQLLTKQGATIPDVMALQSTIIPRSSSEVGLREQSNLLQNFFPVGQIPNVDVSSFPLLPPFFQSVIEPSFPTQIPSLPLNIRGIANTPGGKNDSRDANDYL